MILSQQVCSLELAKRLKELGVKQNSLVYWLEYKEKWELKFLANDLVSQAIRQRTGNGVVVPKDIVSAFTVAELGEMLSGTGYYSFHHSVGFWECFYLEGRGNVAVFGNSHVFDLGLTRSDCEADARAKMLIYLLENKLIMV